jgi:hypothetical protein
MNNKLYGRAGRSVEFIIARGMVDYLNVFVESGEKMYTKFLIMVMFI